MEHCNTTVKQWDTIVEYGDTRGEHSDTTVEQNCVESQLCTVEQNCDSTVSTVIPEWCTVSQLWSMRHQNGAL